jgi:hypothetical protein
MNIKIVGDQMTVRIDELEAVSFSNEGIAHLTKRMITLAVNKSADVDDVKVSKLK